MIPVNDDSALMAVFQGDKCGYVDISGMPHHLWAALVRVGFQALDEFYAVYVEPNEYKRHPNPTSRSEFDLSDGFGGVKPLPGFVRLAGPEDERNAVLVAFLGFEGTRASLVAGTLDPVPKVVPVIGVPGFRCEYPQVAVASNEAFLAEYRAHNDVVFATASCPFEAFDALRNIRKDTGASYLYLATVGTKPHALGAVCYAIRHPKTSELMYDHPVRKAGRTGGVGPVHIYRMKPSHVSP